MEGSGETRLAAVQLEWEDTEESRYYKISTAAELAAFRDIVNGGTPAACAKLMNDIIIYDDLLDEDGTLNKENSSDLVSWEPIGTPEYSGTFDGQGHTIFGLYCERDGDEEEAVAGLFRTINNEGEVRNLNVAESFVSAGGSSGKAGGI